MPTRANELEYERLNPLPLVNDVSVFEAKDQIALTKELLIPLVVALRLVALVECRAIALNDQPVTHQ